MKSARTVCVVLLAVCLSGLVIGGSNKAARAYTTNPFMRQSNDRVAKGDSIEAIVKDATADGGQVVLCRNSHCLDLETHEDVGEAGDGYYILFNRTRPDWQEKLDKYQKRIKDWMEQPQ